MTATTDGVDTVTITSNAAPDQMTMTCFVDQATVNGNLALPVMGCQDVTFVEVDANGGMDTVNLGGVTQLAFPAVRQTSIDVEDSSADSVTGSEARDLVHADGLDDVSTGAGDDWVEGAGSASGGEGNDTLRQISGFRAGRIRRRPHRQPRSRTAGRRQRLRHGCRRLLGLHQPNKRSGWRSPTPPSTARSTAPGSRRTT